MENFEIFGKISDYSEKHTKDLDNSEKIRKIPKYSKISKTFQNIPKYSKIFPKHSTIFQNMKDRSGNILKKNHHKNNLYKAALCRSFAALKGDSGLSKKSF